MSPHKGANIIFANISEYLGKQSKLILTVSGLLIVLVLGIIDYSTGSEISFSIFYLIPIILVGWFDGVSGGLIVSLASAISWYIADIYLAHYSNMLIPFWNAFMRFGIFIFVTLLLSVFKKEKISKAVLEGEVNRLNSELEKKLEETNAELFKKNKELEESEEKYRLLIENAGEVVLVAQDALIKFINPRVKELLGYSPEELTGKPFVDFIHPEDKKLVAERYAKRIKGEDVMRHYNFRVVDRLGNTKWVEISAILMQWLGKPATLNMLTDITERKREEQELRTSEERFNKAFYSSPVAVAINRLESGEIFDVNDAWLELFKCRREEAIGRSPVELGILSLQQRRQLVADLLAKGSFRNTEIALKTCTGEQRDVFISMEMIEINNEQCILTSIFDNTEYKLAEAQLSESEEKYRFITENINDIVWTMDLKLHTTYVSPSIQKMLGFTPEERMAQKVEEQLTPASLSASRALISRELVNELMHADPNRTVSIEVEYYHKDGSTKWAENLIGALRDSKGSLIGMLGVSRDITERKRAQEEIKKRAEELEKMNKFMVGRETAMIELKKEINHLLAELGRPEKYKSE